MKTLICTEPGKFEYSKKEEPQLRKGHAIIKIKRINICGTDLHAFKGTQPFFDYPRILGYELAGEVDPVNYITHRVMFDNIINEFDSLLNPENGVIKAIIDFSWRFIARWNILV